MSTIQTKLKNTVDMFTKKKVERKTNQNLQMPKRRDILKTIAITSVIGPCSLAIGSKLSANDLSKTKIDESFSTKMLDFVNSAKIPELADAKKFKITGKDLPWQNEIMNVKKGQQVTFLLDGKWWMSKEHNVWVEPGIVFHAKVDNEKYYNAGNNTGTMTVTKNGKLKIARSLGEFKNPMGELSKPVETYQKSEGLVEGVALLWEGNAIDGLYKLSAHGDYANAIETEIKRQVLVPPLPKGWKNIFLFDNKGMFFQSAKNEISCITHKNVGILQKDVDVKITEDLKFTWDWNVEKLPSEIAENTAGTHDYLSIAIKFDDGQDITYMWSNTLDEHVHFRCPLDGWNKIETHVVQRSGKKDLGKWLSESRNVLEDYKKLIGGNAKKVTQVWFIANTIFMRGTGMSKYSNIVFKNNKDKTVVL